MQSDPIQDNIEVSAEALAAAQEAAERGGEQDPIAAKDQEIAALKDQLLRALAEMDNTRKRAEKTAADARAYAVTGFARDMLDIADNLRRAIEAVPEAERTGPLMDGIMATERVLLSAFDRHGLKQIIITPATMFDANLHEVMFEQPAADGGPPAGTVIAVLESGYMLNDRLLRPARVGVVKG